jgi:hypothetical protein
LFYCSAALVHVYDRRAVRRCPPIAPPSQRNDDGEQISPLFSKPVISVGFVVSHNFFHQARGHKPVEALRKNVCGDPQAALEIRKAADSPKECIADN